MAFPINSPLGAYQITNLTFNPSTIVPGESTTMSITVKNTSGKKITKMYVHTQLYLPATNSYGYVASSSTYLYGTGDFSKDYGMSAVSWANGASMTFTKVICPTFSAAQLASLTDTYHYGAVSMSGKQWGLLFGIVPNEMVTGSSNTDNFYNVNLQGESGELLHILSKRDNPRLSLNVDRCTNGVLDDEGVKLLTDVKLSCDTSSSTVQAHGYTSTIKCTPAPSGGCTFSATIAQMLTGITDSSSIISGTYSNGTDYSLSLTVSNGYESVSATVSILKSFANVHLSGVSTGGVCFGGFSSATANKPKFECYFPAYFYGGIPSEQYKDGDVVTLTGGTFYGYVSGSTKSINFTVPLRKSLEKIKSATITTFKANIANSGGYAISSSFVSGGSSYMGSAITRTVTVLPETNELEINMQRTTAWSLTNNNTLSVRNESLVITLYE